mmetsp:Transcript_749/g.2492  ORF Transcript_749/g.2492 Transcript_749/m.2492 type:complete len:105 (-) Transcript_749:1078-1392(-)
MVAKLCTFHALTPWALSAILTTTLSRSSLARILPRLSLPFVFLKAFSLLKPPLLSPKIQTTHSPENPPHPLTTFPISCIFPTFSAVFVFFHYCLFFVLFVSAHP